MGITTTQERREIKAKERIRKQGVPVGLNYNCVVCGKELNPKVGGYRKFRNPDKDKGDITIKATDQIQLYCSKECRIKRHNKLKGVK